MHTQFLSIFKSCVSPFLQVYSSEKKILFGSFQGTPSIYKKICCQGIYTHTHTYICSYMYLVKLLCKYCQFWRGFYFLLFLCLSMASAFTCGFSPSHWIWVVKWHTFFSFSHVCCSSFRSPEPCTEWLVSESKISGWLTTSLDIMRRQHKATSLVSTCPSQKIYSVGISAIKQLVIWCTHTGKLASLAFANWRESSSLKEMLSQLSSSLSFHADQFSLQECFISLCK